MGLALIPAAVIGALIGLGLRYLLPGRSQYGLLVLPAAGGAAVCVTWAIGAWAGLTHEAVWIWLIAFSIATIVSIAIARILPPKREQADAELLAELMRPGAPVATAATAR
ncbi:hypothetical protein EV141_1217 [Microcella putealis]|uniref:Uncharacterized protein n=1 Tax=Microcella putealis TaxID=337005 RepID=A0A4Q7LS20_9MICO|nr:hypothetical protein [Microcella putealis]RZS57504.1 hypothetical protein EV141_1217 [Microcella putealis]TQM24571.1 hypothetical protein BJ957_0826 [Microcella putealis]